MQLLGSNDYQPIEATMVVPNVPTSGRDIVTIDAPGTPIKFAADLIAPKVLHVINGEHFSGAERVQQLLGQRLGEFGVESEFACIKPDRFPEHSGLDPSRIALAAMRSRLDLRVVRQLKSKVRAEGFNLLHAHTPRSALVASLIAAQTQTPWCYHVHSPTARDSDRGLVNRMNAWVERFAIRNCTRLLTVSKSLRREMLRLGVSRHKLVVVPNGVPAIGPIDADARLGRLDWKLGLIALMRPRKGIEIAINAIAILKHRGLPVQLELIGGFETESYRAQIVRLIDEFNLQGTVTLSGFTKDIPSALHRLDALLLPSLYGEGMPMVVLEALAAAVPVVATRVEGTPEIIRDSVEGLLAEPGNVDSLVREIMQLTADRESWRVMSRAALQRHRGHFSDQTMARRVADVYKEILNPS